MTISFPTQMFIGGKFVESESGRWMETVDPGTEQKICDVPKGSAKVILFDS